jgi:hypothetical protein
MYYAGDLRKPESKSMGRVLRAMERAREEWSDAERRIRQRMRIYPQKLRNLVSRTAGDLGMDLDQTPTSPIYMGKIAPEPKPIISIHGRDIDEKDVA